MPVQSNVCSRGSPYLIIEQVFDIRFGEYDAFRAAKPWATGTAQVVMRGAYITATPVVPLAGRREEIDQAAGDPVRFPSLIEPGHLISLL